MPVLQKPGQEAGEGICASSGPMRWMIARGDGPAIRQLPMSLRRVVARRRSVATGALSYGLARVDAYKAYKSLTQSGHEGGYRLRWPTAWLMPVTGIRRCLQNYRPELARRSSSIS